MIEVKSHKKYGVVLIGCGHIGEEHARDIFFRDQIHLVGVVDADQKKAREFKMRFGAQSFGSSYKEFLQRKDVDIFIIATYAGAHLEIMTECLRYGKHVLCEKPMATTMEDAAKFYTIVKKSECKMLISHVLRYNETYQTASRIIHSGEIGKIKVMRMVQNHHCKDWDRYKRLLTDCPPVIDCGVHYADVMQWFTGSRIIGVSGFGAVVDEDVPEGTYNYGVMNAYLEDGSVGYYEAGWSRTLHSCNVRQFVGDRGRLSITLNNMRTQNAEEGDLIEIYLKDRNEYKTLNVQSKYKNMWALMESLIDMIESDCAPLCSIEDAFSAFRVVWNADQAIRNRKYITIGSLEG